MITRKHSSEWVGSDWVRIMVAYEQLSEDEFREMVKFCILKVIKSLPDKPKKDDEGLIMKLVQEEIRQTLMNDGKVN